MTKPIVFINRSTRVPTSVFLSVVAACNWQISAHAAPAHRRLPDPVIACDTEAQAPANARIIVVMDSPDQADALGYHTETPDGRMWGRVFINPILDNGGTLTEGPNSFSAVASHEALELFCDEHVCLWSDLPDGKHQIAYEVGDPVQGSSYKIRIRVTKGQPLVTVSVSNFVFPEYFDFQAQSDERFDYNNELNGPAPALGAGGYAVLRTIGTRTTQIFGAVPNPTKSHRVARTFIRMNGREAAYPKAEATATPAAVEQASVPARRTVDPIEQYFAYAHLPPMLQDVSAAFSSLASQILSLARCPERSVALRKLLEAKDAAVRAAREGSPDWEGLTPTSFGPAKPAPVALPDPTEPK